MLAGKRVPSKDKLLTFLAACNVPPDDIPHWLAAWDRVRRAQAPISGVNSRPIRSGIGGWWRPVVLVAVTAAVSVATTVFVLERTNKVTVVVGRPREILTVSDFNWTHWSPDAMEATHAGSVNAGPRPFYCWTWGAPFPRGDRISNKWVETDDGKGSGVYISSLYLVHGDVGDLPFCGSKQAAASRP